MSRIMSKNRSADASVENDNHQGDSLPSGEVDVTPTKKPYMQGLEDGSSNAVRKSLGSEYDQGFTAGYLLAKRLTDFK